MKKSRVFKILFSFAAIILLILFSFILAKAVKRPWNDQARQNAPGEFLEIKEGKVHYQLAGDSNAPLIVLLHGFSIPMYVWDPNFNFLLKQGYQVLRYDHFGRGFSDKHPGPYTVDFFRSQLVSVLNALELEQNFTLVGLSLGGAVALSYAVNHPDRLAALCLIAPAGLPQKTSIASKFYLAPLIGEYLFAVFGDGILKARNENNLYRPQDFKEFQGRFQKQLTYLGFKEALLSTLRHFPMNNMAAEYQKLGKLDLPVLVVWGKKDAVMPYSLHQKLLDYIPRAEFQPIAECGHNVNVEKPAEFNQALAGFLETEYPVIVKGK